MIDFIEKILKYLCFGIGAVILSILGFCSLEGDFGIIPFRVVIITLVVISVLSFIDVLIGLFKAKKTPLFGDKD